MGRPHSERSIGHQPDSTFFKPSGVSMRELRISTILFDELEAMRLVDAEGLQQIQAAERMGISQSTIARLLSSGRKKTAHALAHSEALQLQQGAAPLNYQSPPASCARHGRHGRGHAQD
ncbi:DUF134 domain-containing protein [Pontiella sulfatireligans]|uniref:UPF0251 protein SCARR_01968 n=1 Tax=Pontiella sulfatireligans TaxID=2750658 RepID=A0A6C2UIF7_9BACT|nr:DUF134 domain-containing protein [Pontiella sulfatireligans]VGO19908.1 hypothetical protein SCARR_01968 [Pontiella sulfatireligans]